jgi:CheY-like chemotaxis protein
LAVYLRSCGFKVFEASGASEARDVLESEHGIDILFADAQLAGPKGGFALAAWVRQNRASVKVVLSATLAKKAKNAEQLCQAPRAAPFPVETLLRNLQTSKSSRQGVPRKPRSTGNLRKA